MSTPETTADKTDPGTTSLSARRDLLIFLGILLLTALMINWISLKVGDVIIATSDVERNFKLQCFIAEGEWQRGGPLYFNGPYCELPDGTNLKR